MSETNAPPKPSRRNLPYPPIVLPLSNRLAPFQPALLRPTLVPTALRLALVGDSVSRLKRLEEVASYAPVVLPRPARVPKPRRMYGLGKAANGKMSAGMFLHQLYKLPGLITSRPFVLLTGTVVLVVLLVVGSVGLLYSVGDQELPSVLMGSAVNAKRD